MRLLCSKSLLLLAIWLSAWLMVFTGCRFYRINRLYDRSRLVDSRGVFPQEVRFLQGHFFVRVEIQGRSGWFLWDTGADLTVIDEHWAEGLTLRTVAKGVVNDAQRRRRTLRFCEIERLTLAGSHFERVGAILADLSLLELCEIDLAGILGQTAIYRANWQIRFSDTTLILSGESFPQPPDAKAIPIKLRNLSPYLDLSVGAEPLLCKLDYGSTGGIDLALDEGSVQQLLMKNPTRRYVGAGRGLFGWAPPDTGYLLWTDSVQLGDLPVLATELDLSHQTRTKVGTEVLGRYDAILDFDSLTLWLEPLDQPLPSPEAVFGVYLRWIDTAFVIQALADLRATEGENLTPLQEVAQVQGRPASDFDSHCEFSDWRDEWWDAADTLRLTLSSDTIVSLGKRVPPEREHKE